MAGILSKLKKTPGKTAVRSRPTKIVFPQSYKRPDPSKKPKQTPWYATISKTSWLFFGLFVSLLIAIMATLVFSIHQTKHDAAYQEITGRLQTHSQRIAKASQQTILGHTSAFAQLQDSRHLLDAHLALLT
ncbi:MAG: type IV pili methyl-accepting chemotaxis transducer N-terminal domain-containing protein, partial [Nitrosomonas sp.]|nr:type IV pili methyl-accepting chemotaxis transducer N-terminal domain-containing protein [Nitrosomonas sp.]